MHIKNTVAPKRLPLIIGGSQGYGESQTTVADWHSALCSELLKNPALVGWERLFISTLSKSPKPGRKQVEKLQAIAARLGYNLAEEGSEV